MELKDDDFKHLQYNVNKLSDTDLVLEKFKDLSRFPEFTRKITTPKFVEDDEKGKWVDISVDIDHDKVLRYIILCYDKKTPFMMEKNMVRRKILCAQRAGFVHGDNGKFSKEVEMMFRGENDVINRMIVRYVRNQHDLKYALLVSGLENYYDAISKLQQRNRAEDADDSTTKAELFSKIKKMGEELEILSDDIFNQDKELMYAADVVNEEELERITSYPEFISRQRRKKDA